MYVFHAPAEIAKTGRLKFLGTILAKRNPQRAGRVRHKARNNGAFETKPFLLGVSRSARMGNSTRVSRKNEMEVRA